MLPSDRPKIAKAQALMRGALQSTMQLHVAAQALLELTYVLARKSGLSKSEIEIRLARLRRTLILTATDDAVFDQALEIASRHHHQIYDAVILAAAAVAGCDRLYSEDMQHGFVWRGVEVVNPFL
jgi:predicted nucleic acid-binding protein